MDHPVSIWVIGGSKSSKTSAALSLALLKETNSLSRRYIFALNFVQYFLPLGLISYAYIRIGLVSRFTTRKLFSVQVLFSKKSLSLFQLSRSFLPFFSEPLGEPRARRAGPAARRPHPAQQEEGRQGAHVRRGDIHRVLAAAADLPGLVRHSSAGQQVS